MCASARSALEHVATGRVDVVVSDISMPEMSGLELLRLVHRVDRDLPVILLTGVPCVDTAAGAVEHGAFSYLLKPVGTEVLLHNIARASQQHENARHGRDARARPLVELTREFKSALASLWLAYQPIIRASDHSVAGYEALLRSDNPALTQPEAMLGAAEELATLHQVGRRVRNQAARDLLAAGDSTTFFVNLHPQDLLDEDLVHPESALASVASHVVLEITERATLSSVDNLHVRIRDLRQLGFKIAVDDLGAGYSSLNNVATLEPEFIKLDMTLVRNIERSVTKQRIVSSVVSLAAAMGTTIVAEGVETQAECGALVDLGCVLLQGYLFAKPERRFPSVDVAGITQAGSHSVCDSCSDQMVPSGVHPISHEYSGTRTHGSTS
jgi:EAL domain-containing protein (putative c-di-GMP-specific phosphodiesterase class I)